MSSFAARLHELREAAGLTQAELAARADMNIGGITKLEQGARQPSWETVLSLCNALGVDCTAFTQAPAPRQPPKRGRPAAAKEGRATASRPAAKRPRSRKGA